MIVSFIIQREKKKPAQRTRDAIEANNRTVFRTDTPTRDEVRRSCIVTLPRILQPSRPVVTESRSLVKYTKRSTSSWMSVTSSEGLTQERLASSAKWHKPVSLSVRC